MRAWRGKLAQLKRRVSGHGMAAFIACNAAILKQASACTPRNAPKTAIWRGIIMARV
jgi:hypothetical protein